MRRSRSSGCPATRSGGIRPGRARAFSESRRRIQSIGIPSAPVATNAIWRPSGDSAWALASGLKVVLSGGGIVNCTTSAAGGTLRRPVTRLASAPSSATSISAARAQATRCAMPGDGGRARRGRRLGDPPRCGFTSQRLKAVLRILRRRRAIISRAPRAPPHHRRHRRRVRDAIGRSGSAWLPPLASGRYDLVEPRRTQQIRSRVGLFCPRAVPGP